MHSQEPFTLNMTPKQRGFTIVELLIVIVVIGILAAITIVAYNGVQSRAHAAAAQADATNLSKLLAVNYSTNGSYPTDLTTVNNGGPLSATDNTTYVYHPGASNASYCATVTNATTSYIITDSAPNPSVGGCAGDGQGGQSAITNLAINPSAAVNTNYWSNNGAGGSISRDAATSRPGSLSTGSIKTSYTTTVSLSTQLWDGTTTPLAPIAAGESMTISAWVKSSTAGRTIRIAHRWRNSANSQISESDSSYLTTSTGWTQISFNAQAPATVAYDHISFYFDAQAGDTMWLDDVMVTKGTTNYNYADGNSPNWIWSGAVNNSTSQGPPQ
jgi:prepilin-type N-terminal cleavage/methylation domain-containing protein